MTPPVPDLSMSLRIPVDALSRADRLAERLAADPRVAALAGKPSRAAVLRLAIVRGLEVLEAEHPEPPPTP